MLSSGKIAQSLDKGEEQDEKRERKRMKPVRAHKKKYMLPVFVKSNMFSWYKHKF